MATVAAAAAAAARRLTLAPLRRGPPAAANLRRGFAATSLRPQKWYSKDHEWIDVSEDGKTGTIGVSTYAAKSLGDVVFVELPAPDLVVFKGDAMGSVESVKSASDIYSPVAGKVVERNEALEDKPGTINESPEADGWIARLALEDGEAERVQTELMGADAYADFTPK